VEVPVAEAQPAVGNFKRGLNMYCPKCFTNTLISFKVEDQNFNIEKCSRCGGLWFDGGELEQLLGSAAEADLEVPANSEQTPLPCPRCHKRLSLFKYPRTYAQIEMCKDCKGIWLDKNEFDEISVVRAHSKDSDFHEEEKNECSDTSIKGKLINFINQTIDSLSTMG
jgi:Zn-finger nucleic acid-binding protein